MPGIPVPATWGANSFLDKNYGHYDPLVAMIYASAKGKYWFVAYYLLRFPTRLTIDSAGTAQQHAGYMQTGETALSAAVKHGKSEMVKWLIERRASLDLPDGNGRTALLHAVSHGNKQIAAILIRAGADVNFVADLGLTAMHFATMRQSLDMVQFLLAQGAEIDKKDGRGWTPTMLAVNAFKSTLDGNEYKVSDALERERERRIQQRDRDKQTGLDVIACLIRNGADVFDAKCLLTNRGVLERARALGIVDVVKLIEQMHISIG